MRMTMSGPVGAALVATLAVPLAALVAGEAHGEDNIVLPRAGQVGIAASGQYGTLLDSGSLGGTFGSGAGFGVRLRYRMRYERGIGLSFENQNFDLRSGGLSTARDPASPAPRTLTAITSGIEFYQMFNTRTRNTSMLMLGAGLAQLSIELDSGETQLSGEGAGDGLYLSGGAGVERFFFRSWAVDASTRYFALFKDGKVNHDLQASLGLIFYASY